MIFLTRNCRGMANFIVKRLVVNIKPSIILLQDIMTNGDTIT
jgi:hypothetical protein